MLEVTNNTLVMHENTPIIFVSRWYKSYLLNRNYSQCLTQTSPSG